MIYKKIFITTIYLIFEHNVVVMFNNLEEIVIGINQNLKHKKL